MRILVVAAHPDDEILGCGATVANHVRNGDVVNVEILAQGVTSRISSSGDYVEGSLNHLSACAKKANEILGVSTLSLHNLPDNRLDSLDRLDIVRIIEQKIAEFRPEIVYTHHAGDLNIDHRIAHEAVNTACRPILGHSVKTLLYFETPSSTEWQPPGSSCAFEPSWFVDISAVITKKMQALKAYEMEMRPWPHPRSYEAVEYLARWRGATIGVNAAEAYIVGRHICV